MTAKNGCCLRRATLASLALTVASLPGAAGARSPSQAAIVVPASSLAEALRLIASRTGSEIVTLERGLSTVATPAQRLSGSVGAMLDRLMRGTAFRAVRIADNSFRIERRPVVRDVPRGRSSPPPAVPDPTDIIVTASKFPIPLARYPGSVAQMLTANDAAPGSRSGSMDKAASKLPVLQGTELGEGRNKTFIRGIADSSFNGSTQSTASIYFGDALLGFGSPSPSLKLYDISNVEVLEGPQGTLYGSGSLGGVIHISPNPVDLHSIAGSVATGVSATYGGRPGWDGAAMVNLPLVDSRLGVRVVGYHEHEGGYIDNLGAGPDSNSVNVSGGRAAVTGRVTDSIRLDVGALYQATDGNDAPYTRQRDGILKRNSRIPEPYASKLFLGYVTADKTWDSGLKLTSVTTLGTRSSIDVFDSSQTNRPETAYQIDRSSIMFSHETRLARRSESGLSWVVGATYQRSRDGLTRSLGQPEAPTELDELTNITYAASFFGQASTTLARSLDLTLGVRWTTARTDSEPSRDRRPLIRGVTARRTDPTIALAWRAAPNTILYGRVQTGYRNGGMAVARSIGRVANFDSDSVIMGEIGIRRLRSRPVGLSVSTALSYTVWTDIQADLITNRGLPYTANIGDAKVLAVEASVDWVPLPGLSLGGVVLYTGNRLTGAVAEQSAPRDRRLPETPLWSGVFHTDYAWGEQERLRYRVGATVRYVGRSVLGPGFLSISQGDYTVADLRAGVRHRQLDFSLSAENIFNAQANQFSFGDPISLSALRAQSVPLRPTTYRAAIGFSF